MPINILQKWPLHVCGKKKRWLISLWKQPLSSGKVGTRMAMRLPKAAGPAPALPCSQHHCNLHAPA